MYLSFQKISQAISRVSNVVTDAYFNLVTLLLNTTTTNGAQNNTFLDSSSNAFSITRNGNTTQGTFTPFSQTGWSTFFNGSNQKIASVAGTNFAYGTGAFTVEAFIYLTSYTTPYGSIILSQAVSGTNYFIFQVTTTGQIEFNYATSGGGTYVTSTTTIPLNTWAHVAAVRQGTGTNQFALYINGTNAATSTVAQDFSNTTYTPTIGDYTHTTLLPFAGYISNLRVIKGQALATGNFTSPTSALSASTVGWTGSNAATSITGTVSLLTMQSNRFVDNGAGNTTLTLTNTPSVQAFSPFAPTAAYSTTTIGGSGYFDGTGDQLTAPNNTAFVFGSGNFTVETWAYAIGTTGSLVNYSNGVSSNTNWAWDLYQTSATLIQISLFQGSTQYIASSTSFSLNAWNHIAAVRNGNTMTIYVNGVAGGTTANVTGITANDPGSSIVRVSGYSNASSMFTGYLSNLRILKGTALYTAAFTPPSAPLTAITNTSLLLNATNAGIFDAAAKNDLETVGNAQVSTTQAKFGTTSMYFDGSGDYLSLPARPVLNVSGGRQFTVECWIYTSSTARQNVCIDTASAQYWDLCIDNLKVNFRYNNAGVSITSSASITSGAWNHIAICWTGSAMRIFINGTMDSANSATSMTSHADALMLLGYSNYAPDPQWMNGYIDDFRITNGFARYTANFTAPTAAFPVQ